MSKNYDNWERLVAAVLRRQHDRELAMSHSRDLSSIGSPSSSFNSLMYDPLSEANFEAMNYFYHDMDYQETTLTRCFIDEMTGKKCYMVRARDLKIAFGNKSENWKWRFDADSRFGEVAELLSVWRLDIRATVEAHMLQPRTVYAACLVFKIADRAKGLELAKGMIRFVGDESDREALKRGRIVQLQPVNDAEGENSNGWMEGEIGNFYIGQEDEGIVEARLLEIKRWKTGLVVEGVVFRPTYTYIEAPLVSKKYMLTNVWG